MTASAMMDTTETASPTVQDAPLFVQLDTHQMITLLVPTTMNVNLEQILAQQLKPVPTLLEDSLVDVEKVKNAMTLMSVRILTNAILTPVESEHAPIWHLDTVVRVQLVSKNLTAPALILMNAKLKLTTVLQVQKTVSTTMAVLHVNVNLVMQSMSSANVAQSVRQ